MHKTCYHHSINNRKKSSLLIIIIIYFFWDININYYFLPKIRAKNFASNWNRPIRLFLHLQPHVRVLRAPAFGFWVIRLSAFRGFFFLFFLFLFLFFASEYILESWDSGKSLQPPAKMCPYAHAYKKCVIPYFGADYKIKEQIIGPHVHQGVLFSVFRTPSENSDGLLHPKHPLLTDPWVRTPGLQNWYHA